MAIRAAGIRHASAVPPPRPTCPIPIDKQHAFFIVPLAYDDPDVRSWIDWFRRTRTEFERIDLDGKTQLYLHRATLKHSSNQIERWCCSSRERRHI